MASTAESTNNGVGSGQLEEMPGTYPHFSLAIALLYGMNTGLTKFTSAAGIQFPSALIGRLSFFVLLCFTNYVFHRFRSSSTLCPYTPR